MENNINNDNQKIAMAPREGLIEVRKYVFDGEQKDVYLALYEEYAFLLENGTFMPNQDGNFVRVSEKEIERKMCKQISEMLKGKVTEKNLNYFISTYKSSAEFDGEEGKFLEELSINYAIKNIYLPALADDIKKKLFEKAVADMGRFCVFSSHGDINMQMKTPDGKVVNGEYEIIMDRETLEFENSTLHRESKRMQPNMLKMKISPSIMAMRSHIHILEDAGYSKDEIEEYIRQTDWETLKPVEVVETIMQDAEIPRNQRGMNKVKEIQAQKANEVVRDGRRNRGGEGWVR